ncbi:MAG TPA: PLP-dependent aminotransferase family protein [Burkholderiaceae bacterium]|nr:PLP-dependent aminotransferase family protein [Burkholderiaceae bacterium]
MDRSGLTESAGRHSAGNEALPPIVAGRTLAERLAARVALRIEQHALKPGTRLPSIRKFALGEGVSRSTVVESYDRLIAAGLIESRRGSGFYVSARPALAPATPAPPAIDGGAVDVVWLLKSMLRQAPAVAQPGAGLLPPSWLDEQLIATAVRAVGRTAGAALLSYGVPQGYPELREQLARRLALFDIDATPAQIVTTCGVTQGIDLVARHFVAPGDTVFVEDPAWFVMFARLAAFGAKLVAVPRLADGPDLNVFANLLSRHQPRLFFVNSVLHNPTGASMAAATAHRLLKLAEQYKVTLVEDDVYGDLHPGKPMRLASLDQLKRVIYLGGFSKTLAAGLRVGFLAAPPDITQQLADLKMLTGLTTPELPERAVARVLADGAYRRHVERVRGKLEAARARTARALEKMGVRFFGTAAHGMFLWSDFGRDTNAIAARGAQEGFLCAPGSLFSPTQLPSTWMRISAATCLNPAALRFLAREVDG